MTFRLFYTAILFFSTSFLAAQETIDSPLLDEDVILDPDAVAEPVEIPSPLLAKDNPRPRAIVSSLGLDPDKSLFPVFVVSINDYIIDPVIDGYAYHLAPGSYAVKAQPDMRNLEPAQRVRTTFEAKTYRLNIDQNTTYLLGARIANANSETQNEASWELQLFQLQQRLEIPSPE